MQGARVFSALVTIVLLTAGICPAGYSGGTGEPNSPYRIETPNDLNDIGNHVEDYNKCFILVNDINMAGFTYTTALIAPDTSSSSGFQGTPFTGVFDGNDCNICNLMIDTAGTGNDYLGLFGEIGEPGQVKNLGIEDVNIMGDGSLYVGGICGDNTGTISNCHAIGSVTCLGAGVGGLCGKNGWIDYHNGTIINCYATGSVTNYDQSTGGLCGLNAGDIINSYATGPVTGSFSLGGFCGHNAGTIIDCNATGSVSGYEELGGFCGSNNGNLSNCYATGFVSGDGHSSYIGGLCGSNGYEYYIGGTIRHCYATGSVAGGNDCSCLGGLSGNNNGTISNCYAAGSVSAGDNSTELGGLCGRNWFLYTISKSYATGSVTAGDGSEQLGGLCGFNHGTNTNCYATGSVSGGVDSALLGGLCGDNAGPITNCYATGSITGDNYLGGLCGWSFYPPPMNCYFLDPNDGGGPDNGIGTPLTDEQMKKQYSFSDWDFVEVWNIGENQTYPFLRTHPAGDIDHDDRVNFFDLAIITNHWLEDSQ